MACIYSGKGVTEDSNEAIKWYKKAAEQDMNEAQISLGIMYYSGEGVTKDYVEAYKWILLADWKDERVTKIKKDLLAQMTPDQIDEAQKRANEFTHEKEKERADDTNSPVLK